MNDDRKGPLVPAIDHGPGDAGESKADDLSEKPPSVAVNQADAGTRPSSGILQRLKWFGGRDNTAAPQPIAAVGATAAEQTLLHNIITMRDQRVEEVVVLHSRDTEQGVDVAGSEGVDDEVGNRGHRRIFAQSRAATLPSCVSLPGPLT